MGLADFIGGLGVIAVAAFSDFVADRLGIDEEESAMESLMKEENHCNITNL